MKRKVRKFLAVLLSTTMCLSLAACWDEENITEYNTQNAQVTEVTEQQEPASEVQEEDGSWAVYWYLCGSDLETDGGSVNGAAFDEIYGYDSLDLSEMYQAFDAVWPADTDNPSLELVGFDTCLMATIDVAAVFQNFAKYLVASEEVEPGNGWYYTGWLGALADNPDMNGEDLGIAICNSYYEGCFWRSSSV